MIPATRGATSRIASLLIGACLAAGLSGCSGGLLQLGDAAETAKSKPLLSLSTPQGVPQKYAAKFSEQYFASVKSKGFVIVEPKDAQYSVAATYAAARDGKQGTKVTYALDVTDKAGNKVRHIVGEEHVSEKSGGDHWAHLTDEALQKVAFRSATDLNAWVENPNAATASVAPSPAVSPVKAAAAARPQTKVAAVKPASGATAPSTADAPVVQMAAATPAPMLAVVPLVSGAPGDGRTTLAEAMRHALTKEGVKVVSSSSGAYKIQGQVEMTPSNNGEQSITIRWMVSDPAGRQLERTVVQKNNIPAGSLDKSWGEVADQAAAAAASEIMKLVNKPSGQAQASANAAG